MACSIELSSVNLHYSSLAFREMSLKAYAFGLMRGRRQVVSDVHALKDITLEIAAGERVALIGHNGAGKSTLLKTIAGLYPLSSGIRRVEGPIRALFELNLGFESEATGRENILYRGLLLGETPERMRRLQNEIISFADIGEFIDYPIKTYSAGMQVRLAFAISTAIPGEILLCDEVIGAGDMAFMAKAKERIQALISKSEIMVLASHDLMTVQALCSRAIWLDHGRLAFDGDPTEAIALYQESVTAASVRRVVANEAVRVGA
jgi:lipopolysaccharide transport system ATP-binding protein